MFDINNYTEKTKNVTVADPNGLITVGDDFNGGQFVDVFSATGLVIKKDGTPLVNGKNFTLPTADKLIKEQYGQNLYSQIQMLGTSGVLSITYRCYGQYVSEEIVLQHESRLNGHDTAIATVQDSVTNVESTVSGFDSRVSTVESAVEAAQSSIDTVTIDLGLAQTAITEAQTDIDSLQANVLLRTANDYTAITAETPTDEDLIIFEDASDNYAKKKCPRSALVASGSGSGDVISDAASARVGNIVIANSTDGKHVTNIDVKVNELKMIVPGEVDVTGFATSTSITRGSVDVVFSGTQTGNLTINELDLRLGFYKVFNNCNTNYIYYKTTNGSGVYLAPKDVWDVYCDGTNIVPIKLLSSTREIVLPTITFSMGSATAQVPFSSVTPTADALSEIGSNVFTAKNKGKYQIRSYVAPTASLAIIFVIIYKNGSQIFSSGRDTVNTNSYEIRAAVSSVISLNAGDTLSLYVSASAPDAAMRAQQIYITQIS